MLALAHRLRVEDGDEFVESGHMREAIDRLGIEVEERDVGEASTGRDF